MPVPGVLQLRVSLISLKYWQKEAIEDNRSTIGYGAFVQVLRVRSRLV